MTYSEKINLTRPNKKASVTSAARNAIVERINQEYSMLRRIRVKDNGWFFTFRARFGVRSLHAKAYSLERLSVSIWKEIHCKVDPAADFSAA